MNAWTESLGTKWRHNAAASNSSAFGSLVACITPCFSIPAKNASNKRRFLQQRPRPRAPGSISPPVGSGAALVA